MSFSSSSWLATLYLVAALPACLAGGYLSARFGRRQVMMVAGVPLFLSWCIIAMAPSIQIILAARSASLLLSLTVDSQVQVHLRSRHRNNSPECGRGSVLIADTELEQSLYIHHYLLSPHCTAIRTLPVRVRDLPPRLAGLPGSHSLHIPGRGHHQGNISTSHLSHSQPGRSTSWAFCVTGGPPRGSARRAPS